MKKMVGMNLFELLVTIAIISISLMIAIPSYRSFVRRNQIQTNLTRLVTALNFARTQAILSRQIVTVCPYTKKLRCGHDWAQGLLISAKGQVIKIMDPFKNSQISWNRQGNMVEFSPSGRLKGQNGTFYYQTRGHKQVPKTAVILSVTGRTRIAKQGEDDG